MNPPEAPGSTIGQRALHVTRSATVSFAVLAFSIPLFNIFNSIVRVDIQHGPAPEMVGLPAWVPVAFSIIPLTMLIWTWPAARFYPDLYATIGLAAVGIPLFGIFYGGWLAVVIGGFTMALLVGRIFQRRLARRAAEAAAAEERELRRADRVRRSAQRQSGVENCQSGARRSAVSSPRKRTKRKRGRP